MKEREQQPQEQERQDAARQAAMQEQGTEAPVRGHSSATELVRQLSSEVMSLFTKEISLARSELRESVADAKAGAGSLAGGGVVTLAGLIVLLMAGVYGLGTVLSLWLSALIVGGAVTIVGAIMLMVGRRKLQTQHLKPQRTQEAMRHDQESMRQTVRENRDVQH